MFEIKERLPLVRATPDNGHFDKLKQQWIEEILRYEGDGAEYPSPMLSHAERIVPEMKPRYGIYVLSDSKGYYHGMAHLNVAALPKTTGETLRVVWVQLSPQYDYEELHSEDFARVTGSVLYGVLDLARGDMKADHVKVHLTNMGDKQFAHGVAFALQGSSRDEVIAIRGNWLHIDNVS